jgi:Mycothiol maleylpyruvate isomerase N-terminal domain
MDAVALWIVPDQPCLGGIRHAAGRVGSDEEWEALTKLAEESQTLSAVLVDLEAAEFQRPTNCPPWNLKELVVHTAASIGLRDDFGSPEPGAPLLSPELGC